MFMIYQLHALIYGLKFILEFWNFENLKLLKICVPYSIGP
jgi:hypothetical protein